jgi:hypothetical protein
LNGQVSCWDRSKTGTVTLIGQYHHSSDAIFAISDPIVALILGHGLLVVGYFHTRQIITWDIFTREKYTVDKCRPESAIVSLIATDDGIISGHYDGTIYKRS